MSSEHDWGGSKKRGAAPLCVVFADMVGYSALCSSDEAGTHRIWMDFNTEIIMPAAQRSHANGLRLLGDGCLLSFDDPASALAWCLDVRRAIVDDRKRAHGRWPDLSMRFGLHRCDVIHQNGDIYGDGVNITKRLQERAEGDGILISHAFREALEEGDAAHEMNYLGELRYKNISKRVPTYEMVFSDRTLAKRETGKAVPYIAIMPFANVSGEVDFDYLCEGVIDDIINSLASFHEIQVIARTSTLPFAGRSTDARDISRILSVRYVLQGTLRAMRDNLRLAVTLQDAWNGDVVMAQTCDFSHSEVFAVQDNIVREIVGRIIPSVRALELETALRKPPSSFTAYQCFLRALDLMKDLDRNNYLKARKMLDRALELDNQFALAVAWVIRWYCIMLGQHWIEDRKTALEEVQTYSRRGLAIDRNNAMVLGAIAHAKSYLHRDCESAIVYFDRARQLAPGNALVWMLSSATLSYLDRGEEAIEHAKRALRLSPNDPDLYQLYDFMSIAHLVNEELEEALTWGNLAHAENPVYASNLKALISLNAALGKSDIAHRHAKTLLRIEPDFTVSSYKRLCPLQKTERVEWLTHFMVEGGLPT